MVITLFITGMDYVCTFRDSPCQRSLNRLIHSLQLIAGSRQIFAFSRDQGLPFSKFLYRMDSRTQTPVHAVCFCAFLSLLLGLISFAGPLAVTAVFTTSVVCQYIGFTVPIIARYVGGSEFIHGPFNLGIMVGTTYLSSFAY